jgi:lipoprotein-anchoring transpeptidase ErfK/SrfK
MFRWRLDPEAHGKVAARSAVAAGVVGFALLASHLAAQAWFAGRMLPGVDVGGRNLGYMSVEQARQTIADEAGSYNLKLQAGGVTFQTTAAELGVVYDVNQTLESAYASGRESWLPPLHQSPILMSYNMNWATLDDFTSAVEAKVGTPPVDAAVAVKGSAFTPVPDKDGYTIDRLELVKLIEADLGSPASTDVTLKPQVEVADIQASALGPTIEAAKQLTSLSITLSYNGQTITPSPADIAGWLDFVKKPDGAGYDLVPVVDNAKLKGYVNNLATRLNVSPVSEQVRTINGTSTVLTQGQNGTDIDQTGLTNALASAVTNQQPLTYAIQSYSVPYQTLNTDLHSLNLPQYIEVNLTTQHLWAWQNGQVVYDSPVTSGATGAGFGTPTGLFAIYYKAQNVWLNGQEYGPLYNYNDFVQYWMPFYSGYGLHDASWRHGLFGETSGYSGYWYDGSHGCVNLPLATAAFLYGWAPVGTPVWVHN